MESYRIPAAPARAEIKIRNSRFITSAAPAFSVEEARAFISQIKAEFGDATHNVPAFIIGAGDSTISHCHDDGEPSGTAGRPALSVLTGSGYGDIVVVITRYFGGAKLGVGGLVRAYTEAVRSVLAVLQPAEKVETHTALLVVPYNWFDRAKILCSQHRGEILNTQFEAEVSLTVRFKQSAFPEFQKALIEASHATLDVHIMDSGTTIVPLIE